MVYEWDDTRARRARLNRRALALLVFFAMSGLSLAAAVTWWA